MWTKARHCSAGDARLVPDIMWPLVSSARPSPGISVTVTTLGDALGHREPSLGGSQRPEGVRVTRSSVGRFVPTRAPPPRARPRSLRAQPAIQPRGSEVARRRPPRTAARPRARRPRPSTVTVPLHAEHGQEPEIPPPASRPPPPACWRGTAGPAAGGPTARSAVLDDRVSPGEKAHPIIIAGMASSRQDRSEVRPDPRALGHDTTRVRGGKAGERRDDE